LPVSQFYRATANRDGLRRECIACSKRRAASWLKANRERALERQRQWRAANRHRLPARHPTHTSPATPLAWHHAHPHGSAARYASEQEETREQAKHHQQPWLEDEIKTAIRQDITTKQAALMLGRTFASVQAIRKKHRKVPQGGQAQQQRQAS